MIMNNLVFKVEPTWRMDHWYVVNVVQSALRLEETYNTTMTVELRNSHATIFDSIIYKKGKFTNLVLYDTSRGPLFFMINVLT